MLASSGGQCYLAGQYVSEEELLPPSAAGLCKRPLEEVLTLLRKGALLLKHGRQGKPKVHFFRLANSDTILKWRSSSGSVRQVKLRTVAEVVAGQTTDVFKRHMLRETGLSFSLKYTDDDGSHRTLDLTCTDAAQCEAWFTGLRVVADRLRVTGTPAVPAAAAFAAAQLGAGGGFPPAILSSAELARCYGGGTAVGRASGAMGIPVQERVPGDVLAWGSAARAPAAASTRSGHPDPDAWPRSRLPAPLQGGAALDVRCAAVGRLHGALATDSGAVYTWGEGRSGKLGLGHDQDQPSPARLEHALRGQRVVAVACGDDCTAAVTDAGALYMWGRLAGAPRPQLVPVPIRGGLTNRAIAKVSCGPFHCAAVSVEGGLFTWGEGFGGKLGHGDQHCREQPALVQALLGRQVLAVACGVWHTAAVVVELEGPLAQAAQALTRAQSATSPLKGTLGLGEQQAAPDTPGAEASALSMGAHHRRNSSTSSALSEASFFHEGQGGTLYTWGGVNEVVVYGGSEKRDSNRGCLGHGDADVFTGQLLPTRVSGALEGKSVRHVAAGLHLTVAVTTGGRVFQMGATGAAAAKHCPWEGATMPELVKGALAGHFVDGIACGMHHVLAVARPLDRKHARPSDHGPTVVFTWGRGGEGQLGTGKFDDSPAPVAVDALKGRQVLQVACGGGNALVVCEHDVRRFDPDSKEAADAAMAAFGGMMDTKPPKQLRIQVPEGYATGAMTTSRARSFLQSNSSSSALVPYGGAGAGGGLGRQGSGPLALGASGRPPTIREMYSAMRTAYRQQAPRGGRRLGHSRTDPTPNLHSAALAAAGSSASTASGGGGGGGAPRVLGVPLAAAAASRRGMGVSTSMPSLSGMSAAHSWGAGSELSSISSLRQHSEDWSVGGDSRTPSMALASMDLAAIDEAGSISSLNEEIHEKNRIIERLEGKLQQLRRQTSRASNTDSEDRLRQSVRASAGAFRDSFAAAGGGGAGGGGGRPNLGRPSMAHSDAGASTAGEAEREASLRAMEQLLEKRQTHLETQQHKLAQWAMELQRREYELQRQQAEAEGRPFPAPFPTASSPTGSGSDFPLPIPSESPVLSHRRRGSGGEPGATSGSGGGAAGAAPALRTAPAALSGSAERAAVAAAATAGPSSSSSEQQQPRTPAGSRTDLYGMGTPANDGAATPGGTPAEWMEEIETGVFVTYAMEGGQRKLKRIRFSRAVFSKDSAAKWYDANKHRLAQPVGGTPRVSAQHPPQQQAQRAPATAPAGLVQADQLSRLGSRNLSFDPQALEALQGWGQGAGAAAVGAGSGGAGGQHRTQQPSRLSQVSRPYTAPEAEAASAGPGAGLDRGAGGQPAAAASGQPQPPPQQQQQQTLLGEGPPSSFASGAATRAASALQPPPLSGGSSEANGPAPLGLSPASRQPSQLPGEMLSVSTLCTLPSEAGGGGEGGGGGAAGGGGSGRASPTKRSSQHHHFGSSRGSLARDLSRTSLSSVRTSASDASRASAQFSPRFAAAERKPSLPGAAITALAAASAAAPVANGGAGSSTSGGERWLGSAAGSTISSAASTPRPAAAGSAAAAVDPAPSPSRMARLKAALKPSSKKKEKALSGR